MQRLILLIATVFIFVMLNVTVYRYEQLKLNGDTMLLELAPVDPRSLMQGDYMRLRYALERTPLGQDAPTQKRGFLVVQMDENRVASFIRFHAGEALEADERLLRYHRHYNNMKIVPDAFFFQEGHARYYNEARYGIFKTDNAGRHLLVGLADAEFQPVTAPNTP